MNAACAIASAALLCVPLLVALARGERVRYLSQFHARPAVTPRPPSTTCQTLPPERSAGI